MLKKSKKPKETKAVVRKKINKKPSETENVTTTTTSITLDHDALFKEFFYKVMNDCENNENLLMNVEK